MFAPGMLWLTPLRDGRGTNAKARNVCSTETNLRKLRFVDGSCVRSVKESKFSFNFSLAPVV